MKIKLIVLISIILLILPLIYYNTDYYIFHYFPVQENNEYVYNRKEGSDNDVITIKIKNVESGYRRKHFYFYWEGSKYNARIQEYILDTRGLFFCQNKHLTGEVPLKVIRELSPPLLMLPSRLIRSTTLASMQTISDYDGNLIAKEKIQAEVSFLGSEKVSVEAGNFQCLNFSVRHNYKNKEGNSIHMHTYNYWIADGVGIVKFVHTFIPFHYERYIKPEDKTLMNRYSGFFVEAYELKKANVGGRIIGSGTK